MAPPFVEPTNLQARTAELAQRLGVKWPLIGRAGIPDSEKAVKPYWLVFESLYRYNYIRNIYGSTPPYHNELNAAINEVWAPGTEENSIMHGKFADIVAGVGVSQVSYDEYTTQQLIDEYKRVIKLKNQVADISDAATLTGGGALATGTAGAVVATKATGALAAAGARVAVASTGVGAAATVVGLAALAITRVYLNKSIAELKKILKQRADKGEMSQSDYTKLLSQYN